MSIDWDIVCSIAMAFAAIVALGISIAQIRVSNKQQLLSRRLRLWNKANRLMELCRKHRFLLEKKENENVPEFANDYVFQCMTNNALLYDVGPAIKHVLEQDWHPRFLTKIEELKEMAFEIELVFRGQSAKALSVFMTDYAALLIAMYQYQIMLKHLEETKDEFNYTLDKAVQAVGEEKQRTELYEARDKLLCSFDKLSPRTIKSIISQCRLSCLS